MYLRAIHAEHDIFSLHQFIRTNPLGIFTTAIESPSSPFLQSSHIPFVLDVDETPSETTTANLGTLRGHIARANPQCAALIQDLKLHQDRTDSNTNAQTLSRDVMVLFNGPAHHYVTPKFYTETKPATGKVVPTWNYSAVQVHGRATIFHDSGDSATGAFLDAQVRDLSELAERGVMAYGEEAWRVEDAPPRYVELMKKAIVGVSIEITDIGGKNKMSQEMGAGDQRGVVAGFEALGTEVGDVMARTVREKGRLGCERGE